MTNPFLDADRNGSSTVSSLRVGRSALKVPLNTGLAIGFGGRRSSTNATGTAGVQGNRRVNQQKNLTIPHA